MGDDENLVIDGVAYMSLHHHDGRFLRYGGRYAFARRDADGGHTLFCLEPAKDISREAVPGHRAWAYAVSRGMNEILVQRPGPAPYDAGPTTGAPACSIRLDLYREDDLTEDARDVVGQAA